MEEEEYEFPGVVDEEEVNGMYPQTVLLLLEESLWESRLPFRSLWEEDVLGRAPAISRKLSSAELLLPVFLLGVCDVFFFSSVYLWWGVCGTDAESTEGAW